VEVREHLPEDDGRSLHRGGEEDLALPFDPLVHDAHHKKLRGEVEREDEDEDNGIERQRRRELGRGGADHLPALGREEINFALHALGVDPERVRGKEIGLGIVTLLTYFA